MSQQPPAYPPPGEQYGAPSPPVSGDGTGKTKVMGLDQNVGALLCYVPVCCLNLIFAILWLATEPRESKFMRFHAIQSLLLMGVGIVVYVVFWFLGMGMIFSGSEAAAAGGSILISIVFFGFCIVMLVLFIIGIVKAYQRQMWQIPVIGGIADKNS